MIAPIPVCLGSWASRGLEAYLSLLRKELNAVDAYASLVDRNHLDLRLWEALLRIGKGTLGTIQVSGLAEVFVSLALLASFIAIRPTPVRAASGPYADIIRQLDVEVGTVTLPGAGAEGFDSPHRWTVTVGDPGKACLEVLRQRYEDLVRLRYVDWDDLYVQEKVARMSQDLAWRISQQDPHTGAIPGGLSTVRQMAFAYHIPGTPYYHDLGIIADHIEPAIIYERDDGGLHPENAFQGNWWTWEVAVPFQIIDILFTVGDQMDREPRDALEDMLIWTNQWSGHNASSSPPYDKYSPTGDLFNLTEANGAWFRAVALLTGLYFRLPPVVQWATDEINLTAVINPELGVPGVPSYGVKPDFTFWDHALAPNQLYGDHLYETLAFVAYLTDGSPCYGLSGQVDDYLSNWFHEWLRWNTFRALEMPASRGRWPHLMQNGQLFMGAVFRLNTADVAYSGELVRLVADWLAEHPGDLDMRHGWWGIANPWFGNFHVPGDSLIAQPLLAAAQARQAADPPIGARYYPHSEFLVLQRPGWYGALAMRGELNPMGSINRAQDGSLLVLTDDNYTDYDDLDEAARELYDAVTGVQGDPFNYWLRDQSRMAGGVTLGKYAVAGVDLHVMESLGTWVDAQKACFFFDAEIVCVGGDISSDDSRPVRTYIRAFPEGSHTLRSGTGWLHDGAVGVVLPDRPLWESERLTFVKDPPWLRLYLSHGVRPAGATYTLIYLPQATLAETQQYAGAPDIQVLARAAPAHIVRDDSSGITGAVFFGATSGAVGHACSGHGHLIYRAAGGRVESLAFYNPTGEETSFDLTVPMPASSWLVAQAQADPTVESFVVRPDGFDLRFTLSAFGNLVWYREPPDLSSSTKAPSSSTARQGEVITYALTIRNTGGPLTTPVSMTDVLPTGLVYGGGLCASSWGAEPVCQADRVTWTDVLSATPKVVIYYAVQVTVDQPAALANWMEVDAKPYGLYTRSAMVIANPLSGYLPLILRGTGG